MYCLINTKSAAELASTQYRMASEINSIGNTVAWDLPKRILHPKSSFSDSLGGHSTSEADIQGDHVVLPLCSCKLSECSP